MPSATQPDDDERQLCADCIGEPFLKALVVQRGVHGQCSSCERFGQILGYEAVADEIEAVFKEHYQRTATEPEPWQAFEFFYRDGEPAAEAIEQLCDIDSSVAEELRKILADRHYDMDAAAMGEECEFGSETHYEESRVNDNQLHAEWRNFEDSLRTKSRYFNDAARQTLDLIFADLETSSTRDGERAIRTAGPDTDLNAVFRARVFQSPDALNKALARPDLELAAPPSHLAGAGRMNARGVSVFYGASDQEVALSEVRPPVGSRVLVGRFNFARPVRLLDVRSLERLSAKGSLFDRSYSKRLKQAKFLSHLASLISRPIMPSDEAMDYLPTQAMADYLAARADLNLDGIIFRSAQSQGSGFNVCLFNAASRTVQWLIPEGTEIQAGPSFDYGDDGQDRSLEDYFVSETPPPKAADDPQSNPFRGWEDLEPVDQRMPALQLDPSTLQVLHITGVSFSKTPYAVRRERSEKPAKSLKYGASKVEDLDF